MGNPNPTPKFQTFPTKDGSPTVIGPEGEPMHSRAGALSESLYIYGSVIAQGFECFEHPHILSVGLGLGYNELIVAAQSFLQEKDFSLHSREVHPLLTQAFTRWLKDSAEDTPDNSLHGTYDQILYAVASGMKVKPLGLKGLLREAMGSKAFSLGGSLEENTPPPEMAFNIVLFDAYSSKTSPELWDEQFLQMFLDKWCAPKCLFTTYAKTGPLKRALLNGGFSIEKRPGFAGKRDSTLAHRSTAASFNKDPFETRSV